MADEFAKIKKKCEKWVFWGGGQNHYLKTTKVLVLFMVRKI